MALPKNDINKALNVDGLELRTMPDGTVVGKVTVEQPEPPAPVVPNLVVTDDNGILDTSWQDIFDALSEGTIPMILSVTEDTSAAIDIIISASVSDSSYGVTTLNELAYATDSADGYPEIVPDENEPVM